jgi:hypothetical protein
VEPAQDKSQGKKNGGNMAHVSTTKINQFVPVGMIGKSAGTWTLGVSSNVVSEGRTAGAASFDLILPVFLPGSEAYHQGAKLKAIKLYYQIGTAAATDFATVALHKMTLGAAISGEAVGVTLDSNHDTAAKRKAVGMHEMVITLNEGAWLKEDEGICLQCVVSAAATTVFTLFGAVLDYEMGL